ncbi:hypothetical protein [Aquimarina rhabdastrellae]
MMKNIFIYSKENILKIYGRGNSEKGKMFLELLGINDLGLKEVIIKNTQFEEIQRKVKLALEKLISENKNSPMIHPTNLENQNFDSFVEKEILGTNMRLFLGGIEGNIIGLSNLYDLLELIIDEKHSYFKVVLLNHLEHRQWLASFD